MSRSPVSRTLLACAATLFACAPAGAHEFWIEPTEASFAAGEPIVANLYTGQHLSADPSSWYPDRFARLVLVDAEGEREVDGTRGDVPAVVVPTRATGAHAFVGTTKPQSLRYGDFAKFEAFTAAEGSPEVAERHAREGLPTRDFVEIYTRHAKALVRVGGASGAPDAPPDRAFGLELELVALDDPFAADAASLRFELRFDGEPVADHQVALLHRTGPNPGADAVVSNEIPANVARALARTDADGRVAFEDPGAGTSLVSAVIIRRPSARAMLSSGAVWESLWASLAFVRD